MKVARDLTRCLGPPTFFGEAYSMFAGDHPTPRQDLCEKFVQRVVDSFADFWVVIIIRHDVDVHVPISGMPETRVRKSMLRLKFLRDLDKIDNVTARDDGI